MSSEFTGTFTSLIVQATVVPLTVLCCIVSFATHVSYDNWEESIHSKYLVFSVLMGISYAWQASVRLIISVSIVSPAQLTLTTPDLKALLVTYAVFSAIGALCHLRMLYMRCTPVVSNSRVSLVLKVLNVIAILSLLAHIIHFMIYVSFYFDNAEFLKGYSDGAIVDSVALFLFDFLSLAVFIRYRLHRMDALSGPQVKVTQSTDRKLVIISSFGIAITIVSFGFIVITSMGGLGAYTAPLGCVISILWMGMKFKLLMFKHQVKSAKVALHMKFLTNEQPPPSLFLENSQSRTMQSATTSNHPSNATANSKLS
jgi:hypothetical protein